MVYACSLCVSPSVGIWSSVPTGCVCLCLWASGHVPAVCLCLSMGIWSSVPTGCVCLRLWASGPVCLQAVCVSVCGHLVMCPQVVCVSVCGHLVQCAHRLCVSPSVASGHVCVVCVCLLLWASGPVFSRFML